MALDDDLLSLLEARQFKEAKARCTALLEQSPNAELWHTMGDIESGLAHWTQAQKAYQHALEYEPQRADTLNNLGVLAQKELEYQGALDYYLQAHAADPEDPLHLYNTASVYVLLGDRQQAMAYARQTLQLSSTYPLAYDILGQVLQLFGDQDNAIDAFQQAIYLDRSQLRTYFRLGQLYQAQRNFDLAIVWYERLISQQIEHETLRDRPLLSMTYHMLAFCYREQGKTSEAIESYQTALEICPTDATLVAMNLFLPPVYHSHQALTESRARFEQGITQLEHRQDELIDPIDAGLLTPFYLAYQGQDDRALLERVGRFFQRFVPSDLSIESGLGDKIRIGFVSSCLYSHSVTDYFAELILGLPQEDFEVYLFDTSDTPPDHVTERFRQNIDHYVSLPQELDILRKTIAHQALDILVYPDIGMDPVTYFLAMTRLAPVQCVMMGHPVTTGLSSIDYFLSSKQQEPEGAEAHYTEKLITFEHIPASYPRPEDPGVYTRQDLGLPKLGNIYVCPQTLYKIHPDFDAVLQQILDLDRRAFIYLFCEEGTTLHEDLKMRFENSIPRKNHRIKFIPRLSFVPFLGLLKVADVILDSIHFGGGSTSYLAFAMNAPVVTWPGPFLRGRTTFALYQSMGISEGIAENLNDYAPLAVKIAQGGAYRDMLKQKIAQGSDALFSNAAAVAEVSSFFKETVRKE